MKKRKIFIGMLLLLVMFIPLISVNAYTTVTCGNITGIPYKIPQITAMLVSAIQIAVPLILVISGTITLIKSLTAKKEDEFKAARVLLTKKLIVAAIIFLSVAIVKLFVSIVANTSDDTNISQCIDCFMTARKGKTECYLEEEKN